MAKLNNPEWAKPKTKTTGRDKSGKFLPGHVANPKGRAKGVPDKRTALTRALKEDAEEIISVVRAKALDGDMQAAAIILNRVAPPVKPQHDQVQFTFDPDGTLSDNVSDILKAVSDGRVPPDVAKSVIDSLGALALCRQTDEIEKRLQAIENMDGRVIPHGEVVKN